MDVSDETQLTCDFTIQPRARSPVCKNNCEKTLPYKIIIIDKSHYIIFHILQFVIYGIVFYMSVTHRSLR